MNLNGRANSLLKAINRPPFVFMPNWPKGDVFEALGVALRAGFTAVDTAAHSKACREEIVGAAVSHALRRGTVKRRKDLFIQTRYIYPLRLDMEGLDTKTIRNIPVTPLDTKIRTAVTTSLRKLSGTDDPESKQNQYVDCTLLHLSAEMSHRSGKSQEMLDAWGILETYVPERTRHLGIANTTLPMLELLYNTAKIKPAVVQNMLTMTREDEIGLRNFCTERDIVYQAYPRLTKKLTFLEGKPVMALAEAAGIPRNRALSSLVSNLPNVAVINSAWKDIRIKEEVRWFEKVRAWAERHNEQWEHINQDFRAHVDMKGVRQAAEGGSKNSAKRLRMQASVEA